MKNNIQLKKVSELEKAVANRPELRWVNPEMQDRLFCMLARGVFAYYTFETYLGHLKCCPEIFRRDLKQAYTRCENWGARYMSDIRTEFPQLDTEELFLDLDDAFRNKPVSEGSTNRVRDHIEQLQAMFYNELSKSIPDTNAANLLSYAEAVAVHIMMCALFNGVEIDKHPCLLSYNRIAAPATPFAFAHTVDVDTMNVHPNTLCTFLHAFERLCVALYKHYGKSRDEVFRSFSAPFVKRIDEVFVTLVNLFANSKIYEFLWDDYRKDIGEKAMLRQCIDRSRRCMDGRVW